MKEERELNQEKSNNNEIADLMRYEDAGLCDEIKRAVHELGFENMTPIQAKAIPKMLEGLDVIGQAQTGTGKTAAFGIPIIQMVAEENAENVESSHKHHGVKAMILCPTRELAIQAAGELRLFAKYMHGVKILPIFGGQDISRQIRSLKENVDIIVGTPGRVMDHMRRHTLKVDSIRMLVLDEADEMLNMGFREDIETICQSMPEQRQTALFSATMPKAILDITHKYQQDAVLLKMPAKEVTIPLVKQYYYEVKSQNKDSVVCRLIDYYNPKRTLIFCNTKRKVDQLSEELKGRGYFAEGLHGDLSQAQRDNVMHRFRGGKVDILIATDVAARGIDVDDVEAVINYDVPQDIEYYVHRIGRTGRAGKKGRSFTLVVGKEIYKIRDIERSCKTKMKARVVPSAADVTSINADKVLSQVLDIVKKGNLSQMLSIIEGRVNEEDYTAMELAAAFLKMHMGDNLEDIPTEDYFSEKKKRNKGSYDQKGGHYGKSNYRNKDNRGDKPRKWDKNGKSDKGGKWDKGSKSEKSGKWSKDKASRPEKNVKGDKDKNEKFDKNHKWDKKKKKEF